MTEQSKPELPEAAMLLPEGTYNGKDLRGDGFPFYSREQVLSIQAEAWNAAIEAAANCCDEDAKEFGHPMKRAGAEACAIRLRTLRKETEHHG